MGKFACEKLAKNIKGCNILMLFIFGIKDDRRLLIK